MGRKFHEKLHFSESGRQLKFVFLNERKIVVLEQVAPAN